MSRFRILGFLALIFLPLSGCLLRSHTITKAVFVGTLKEATLTQLVEKINSDAARIKTVQATVDIDSQSTVDIDNGSGGTKKGKVTDYQEVRGYVLLRKPGNLRMTGLVPVVRNKMFDMVSDGERFRLSVPPKNKFVIGSQEVKTPSKKGFENLRPRQIYEALLVDEIDPKTDVAVLENSTVTVRDVHRKEVEEPSYILTVVHLEQNGTGRIERKIYISREDLSVQRQVLFDKAGNIDTIGTYSNYSEEGDRIMFPHLVRIDRPKEQYGMVLGMVKVQINVPLTDDQFDLPRPEGSDLQVLDNVSPDLPPRNTAPRHTTHNR